MPKRSYKIKDESCKIWLKKNFCLVLYYIGLHVIIDDESFSHLMEEDKEMLYFNIHCWYGSQFLLKVTSNSVNTKRKPKNVPNVPQLYPIERVSRNLKRDVYGGSWEASNKDNLKQEIKLVCP